MAPTSNALLVRGTPIAEWGQANIVRWDEDEVQIIDAYVRENLLTSVPTNYEVEELRELLGMSPSFEWPARIFPILDNKLRSKMRSIISKNKRTDAMDTRPDRARAIPGSDSRSARSITPPVDLEIRQPVRILFDRSARVPKLDPINENVASPNLSAPPAPVASAQPANVRAYATAAAATATTPSGDIRSQSATFEPPVPAQMAQDNPRFYGSTSTRPFQRPDIPVASLLQRPTSATNLGPDSYYRDFGTEYPAPPQPQAWFGVNREPSVAQSQRHSEEIRSRTSTQNQATAQRGEGAYLQPSTLTQPSPRYNEDAQPALMPVPGTQHRRVPGNVLQDPPDRSTYTNRPGKVGHTSFEPIIPQNERHSEEVRSHTPAQNQTTAQGGERAYLQPSISTQPSPQYDEGTQPALEPFPGVQRRRDVRDIRGIVPEENPPDPSTQSHHPGKIGHTFFEPIPMNQTTTIAQELGHVARILNTTFPHVSHTGAPSSRPSSPTKAQAQTLPVAAGDMAACLQDMQGLLTLRPMIFNLYLRCCRQIDRYESLLRRFDEDMAAGGISTAEV